MRQVIVSSVGLAIAGAIVLGYLGISRGFVIEPPAFVANAVNTIAERLAQRAGGPMGQTP